MDSDKSVEAGVTELWRHPNPKSTHMWKFIEKVNEKYGLKLETYRELYGWSVDNIAEFWEETWYFTGIKASRPFEKVLERNSPIFPRPNFFEGSLLNFAENLLYPPNITIDPSSPALISVTESTRTVTTWASLRESVRQCTFSLLTLGVQPHDRVAGFLGNHANTVIAMLATTSIGAIWTGVSPDTGVVAVLDRLVQIEPVVLFADNGVEYNGKIHESATKTREIVKELKELKALVVFSSVRGETDVDGFEVKKGKAWKYEEFLKNAKDVSLPLTFAQLPPSHPIYILYSSGTTGLPKCIIHSAIGTLIQHKKEHILHCDVRPGDRFFYFTTCTWMMWHWLISGLATGATLILYDGSPFKPHGNLSMPLLIQELGITHFGTSAKYLSILEQNHVYPFTESPPVDLSSLKAIYSTGSPLAPSTFEYVYKAFPKSINLGSITGGTDIVSLFGAPCPLTPVYQGEIQVPGLGMAIASYSPEGTPINDGTAGDLVCTRPFPCQPVGFFGTMGEKRYKSSYFEMFEGVWHHGDFIRISPATQGLIMLGRSDGILKPSGVRFGSAEIYNLVLKNFASEVEDALCVGRRREGDDDEVVVLFLKMNPGQKFTASLVTNIKNTVRTELSARHVPGIIDECFEIPVTTNGKKVEVAVKQILCGMDVKTSASVANKECLEWYREWTRSH